MNENKISKVDDLKKLLQVNEYQNKIYIHNEIFTELERLYDKGSSHVAFGYSFYYILCWLYRYAKYGELDIDIGKIKEILGYNAENKKINYLIKKGGVLDEIGLTRSDTDYPIAWSFVERDLEFTMMSEMENEVKEIVRKNKGRNYKVKIPVKALWRDVDSEIENVYDGTFYEIDNTHEMSFDVFVECMQKRELGCSGFYLYGYLKYKCDKHGEYNSSLDRISEDTGIGRSTVDKYLGNLCNSGLIRYKENECRKIEGKFKKQANSYSIA